MALSGMRRFIRGKARPNTASVLQFENVHEEVIPSVCHALQSLGVTPTAYLNEGIAQRRGDVYPHLCPGMFDYKYVKLEGRPAWDTLKTRLRARKDPFVFVNTLQRDGIADFVADLNTPVLGIVHNPELFLKSPACVALANKPHVGLITMADHVASYLIARKPEWAARVATLEPIYWGEQIARPDPAMPRRRVVVPGAVNFKNRDYRFLFDAFTKAPDLSQRLEIRILGGGPDRAALEAQVAELGLAQAVTFSPTDPETGFVGHEAYFADLRSAAFLLPLLPPQRQDYRVYKITLGVPTAQAFCIPPLLDRWTSLVYRVPSLVADPANLAQSLHMAAMLPQRDYAALLDALKARRQRLLARNSREMAYLCAAIGLTDLIPAEL